MTEKPKKLGIKQLTEKFWELSRVRQEAFLKEFYNLSPQNKDFCSIWLGKDNKNVIISLKKDIHKETINRIGKFRKLRLSKLNEILRNADKYSLSELEKIELKNDVWQGMLAFVVSKRALPDRYEIATARHLDQYLTMVKHHVLETSERDEILEKKRKELLTIIEKGAFIPHVEDIYLKHFH